MLEVVYDDKTFDDITVVASAAGEDDSVSSPPPITLSKVIKKIFTNVTGLRVEKKAILKKSIAQLESNLQSAENELDKAKGRVVQLIHELQSLQDNLDIIKVEHSAHIDDLMEKIMEEQMARAEEKKELEETIATLEKEAADKIAACQADSEEKKASLKAEMAEQLEATKELFEKEKELYIEEMNATIEDRNDLLSYYKMERKCLKQLIALTKTSLEKGQSGNNGHDTPRLTSPSVVELETKIIKDGDDDNFDITVSPNEPSPPETNDANLSPPPSTSSISPPKILPSVPLRRAFFGHRKQTYPRPKKKKKWAIISRSATLSPIDESEEDLRGDERLTSHATLTMNDECHEERWERDDRGDGANGENKRCAARTIVDRGGSSNDSDDDTSHRETSATEGESRVSIDIVHSRLPSDEIVDDDDHFKINDEFEPQNPQDRDGRICGLIVLCVVRSARDVLNVLFTMIVKSCFFRSDNNDRQKGNL